MTEEQIGLRNLASLIGPIAKSAGLELRDFSIGTSIALEMAGIKVGTGAFAGFDTATKAKHLNAFLAIQAAPLEELEAELFKLTESEELALDDTKRFAAFYRAFVFPFTFRLPVDGLLAAEAQLSRELPAIKAATVDVKDPDKKAEPLVEDEEGATSPNA